jgi:protein-S-isoprenylcysteine O-methyltransferase Ste14
LTDRTAPSWLTDFLGKAAVTAVFSALAVKEGATIVMLAQDSSVRDYWQLTLASRICALLFLLLVVWLTVTRLPARDNAAGIEPRISAVAGTFILMLLVFLPPASIGPGLRLLSTALILSGTLIAIYCLYWLGRSFSIMATARGLVTGGPYDIVRHPLYVAEAISVIGILISNWSLPALLIVVVQLAFQLRRMYNEERVLRRVFPEYAAYCARVPMLIPGLRSTAGATSTGVERA